MKQEKGTLRVSGGRKAYGSWGIAPTWLGYRMSFTPPVVDFSYSFPKRDLPATTALETGVMRDYLPEQKQTLKTQTYSTAKPGKGRMPRARKARARLRRQQRMRAHIARTN